MGNSVGSPCGGVVGFGIKNIDVLPTTYWRRRGKSGLKGTETQSKVLRVKSGKISGWSDPTESVVF